MQSFIYFSLALGLFTGLASINATAQETTPPAPVILILGDSLSAAHNISRQDSWPVLLQQQLQRQSDLRVVNASISGETSIGGRERLPDLLSKYQPQILILELGGNDGLRGYSFRQTRQNLADMIELALDRKIQVLLIGVRMPPNLGPVYNRRFQQIYQTLADRYAIIYLPRFLEGIAASDPKLMQSDGIHPTALAQPKLAERVMTSLQPMISPRAAR